ncbi:hypothetical protein GCM10011508_13250 [Flavobacterium lutivivi]|nr:hypothetical protein GCM10011508_13250 [Flavobacterium lutivivi]
MNKFIILLVIYLFLSCSIKREKSFIGKQNHHKTFSLNKDVTDSLMLSWNDMLKASNINSKIVEINIQNDIDLKTKKQYYKIFGKTNNDSAKVACLLELKNGKFYFEKGNVSKTVICHGSSNCKPEMYEGQWVCNDGSKTPSCSLNCQKKVVAVFNENYR